MKRKEQLALEALLLRAKDNELPEQLPNYKVKYRLSKQEKTYRRKVSFCLREYLGVHAIGLLNYFKPEHIRECMKNGKNEYYLAVEMAEYLGQNGWCY